MVVVLPYTMNNVRKNRWWHIRTQSPDSIAIDATTSLRPHLAIQLFLRREVSFPKELHTYLGGLWCDPPRCPDWVVVAGQKHLKDEWTVNSEIVTYIFPVTLGWHVGISLVSTEGWKGWLEYPIFNLNGKWKTLIRSTSQKQDYAPRKWYDKFNLCTEQGSNAANKLLQ